MTAGPPRLRSIGELADEVGLTPSAIRFYDKRGLLAATERIGGRRYFDDAAVGRAHAIAWARRAGFTVTETRQLLQADRAGPDRRGRLVARKLDDLRGSVETLQAMIRMLEAAQSCGCGSFATCADVAAARPVPGQVCRP